MDTEKSGGFQKLLWFNRLKPQLEIDLNLNLNLEGTILQSCGFSRLVGNHVTDSSTWSAIKQAEEFE